MSSCSRNHLCAPSPLKSGGSLQQLSIFPSVKSHSRQDTNQQRFRFQLRVQVLKSKLLLFEACAKAPKVDADCHLSPPSARVFLTINSEKSRPMPRPRQYSPYANETPLPKLCQSGKEIACVLQMQCLGPANGSAVHSSKLFIKEEVGKYNIIKRGPGIMLGRPGK